MRSITINHVTKTYGAVTALKDVSLTFEENKIYGLLGRNGAGKSTPVSYTHLDVYKRQAQSSWALWSTSLERTCSPFCR